MSDSDTNTEAKNEGADEKRDSLPPSLKRRTPVDFGMQSAAVIAAIFGIAIAVVSVYTFKSKESIVLWLGYFAIIFTLLAFTLYWQKRIWENAAASTSQTNNPTPSQLPAPLPAQETARPFSVAVEYVLGHGHRRMKSWHWVTYYGDTWTACPVSVALHLLLINLRPVPSMIYAFRAEAQNGKDEWVKLEMMDVHSPGNDLYYVVGPLALKEAAKMDMKTVSFDYLITKRLEPHEHVRGWAFFAAPEEVRVEDGDSVRIYLRDAEGVETKETVILGADREDAVHGGVPFNYTGDVENISGYKLKYWREDDEQPE